MKTADAIRARVTSQEQEFDGDRAREAHLACAVDDPHAAMAELFLEDVVSQNQGATERPFRHLPGRCAPKFRCSWRLKTFVCLVVQLGCGATFHAAPAGAAGSVR